MNEGRKRVLLIDACILAAGKLALLVKSCPAMETAIADGIAMAERIMRKIDALHPDKS